MKGPHHLYASRVTWSHQNLRSRLFNTSPQFTAHSQGVVSGRSVQGPEWHVTCHSICTILRPVTVIRGQWAVWPTQGQFQGENTARRFFTKALNSGVARIQEPMAVPFMWSIKSMTNLTHGGRESNLTIKKTSTLKLPFTFWQVFFWSSCFCITEFTAYILFCFFFHLFVL